ncbi:MAG: DUF3545 family protein [Succinivibrionaceae bacterium]|nr:DUF3545 family protein [Ruminobacter sp.]MDY5780200.1 DUF3545 family protein [Succinivibrionaceae bacterium]MEE1340491.1 DUF3545 family protein [Succinivibrionaceae bacterium]
MTIAAEKLSDTVVEASLEKAKKDKKSRWRDIEKVKDNIRLLKALKEIDADYVPYDSNSYMEF